MGIKDALEAWVRPGWLAEDTSAAVAAGSVTGCREADAGHRLAAHHTAADTASTEAEEGLMESAGDLEFIFAAEVHYHRSREGFLSSAHRWMMFGTIVFGASAAAALIPVASGLMAAALGAADIAFDFTGRAAHHGDIRRRYLALVSRLSESNGDPDVAAALRKAWFDLSADEPPPFKYADMLANNAAVLSLGRGKAGPIAWWQRIVAQIYRG